MSDGLEKYNTLIAQLRDLPKLPERVLPELGAMLREEVAAMIDAGVAPDGAPWEPTATGAKALRNAAAKLQVGVVGRSVILWVNGPEARHNKGWVKGGRKRQFVPEHLTPHMVQRVHEIVGKHLREAVQVP